MIYIYIIRTCYKRWIEVLPKPVAVTFLLGILPNFQLPLLKVSRASHHIFSTYMYRYKLCMYKWNKYIDLKRKLIHVNTCIYILRGMIEPPKAQNCFKLIGLGSRMQSDCWSGFNRRRRCMRMPRLWSIAHLHLQKSHDLSDFMMLWLRNFVTWSLHHLIWPAGPWVLVLQMTTNDSEWFLCEETNRESPEWGLKMWRPRQLFQQFVFSRSSHVESAKTHTKDTLKSS